MESKVHKVQRWGNVGGAVRVGRRTVCCSNVHLGNTRVFFGIVEWWYQIICLKRATPDLF